MHANQARRGLVFEGVTVGQSPEVGRHYAFFVYSNPGLREWFNHSIETLGAIDQAFGGSGEARFFLGYVNRLILQLDEKQPEIPDKRFYYN